MAAQTLSIIGLGLIGGSIGLAARKHLSHLRVIGYDHFPAVTISAVACGAVHAAASSIESAIRQADLLLICVPPTSAAPIFRAVAETAPPGLVVTDVASTKAIIVAAGDAGLGHAVFVGSHPIAGSEKGGIAHASPDLFNDALCIMTPTENTSARAVGGVESFWSSLGLQVMRMSPQEHDRVYAGVSHLPHAVAAALVNATLPAFAPFVGKGFLDATRIAAGDGELWASILSSNAANVQSGLRALIDELQKLAAMLDRADGQALTAYLSHAADIRRAMSLAKPSDQKRRAAGDP